MRDFSTLLFCKMKTTKTMLYLKQICFKTRREWKAKWSQLNWFRQMRHLISSAQKLWLTVKIKFRIPYSIRLWKGSDSLIRMRKMLRLKVLLESRNIGRICLIRERMRRNRLVILMIYLGALSKLKIRKFLNKIEIKTFKSPKKLELKTKSWMKYWKIKAFQKTFNSLKTYFYI